MELSNCCNAEVKVVGATTKYYFCTKCLEPCDLADMKIFNDDKILEFIKKVDYINLDENNEKGAIEFVRQFFKEELKKITDLIKDKKSEHNDWCESLENKDMPCDCGVAEYNLGLKESINIIKTNLT